MEKYKWNYLPPEQYRTENVNQNDWNETLITTINKAFATYRNRDEENRRLKDSILNVPWKFFPLFVYLTYFDYEKMVLAGRYKINIIHEDLDYIECNSIDSIIEIENLYEKWEYID